MRNVIVAVFCTAALVAAVLFGAHAITDALPRAYECDTCGAHVLEVWHTRADDGEWLNVCTRCADAADSAN